MVRIKKKHETGNSITTPSWFGSHQSMVVNEDEYNESIAENEVLCKDDRGVYVTLKKRLDTGAADPARYSTKRKDIQRKE